MDHWGVILSMISTSSEETCLTLFGPEIQRIILFPSMTPMRQSAVAALWHDLGTVDLISHQETSTISASSCLRSLVTDINSSLKFLFKARAGSFAVQTDVNAFQLIFNNIVGTQVFQPIQNNEDQLSG